MGGERDRKWGRERNEHEKQQKITSIIRHNFRMIPMCVFVIETFFLSFFFVSLSIIRIDRFPFFPHLFRFLPFSILINWHTILGHWFRFYYFFFFVIIRRARVYKRKKAVDIIRWADIYQKFIQPFAFPW